MKTQSIRNLINKRPFRPIEVEIDGREKVVIRHPEAVLVGKRLIMIEHPDGSGDYIDASHVSRVRILAGRNGGR
ncbi:MAG: hypothetical protein A3F84_02295 [Candidatus Handelsmanbacteria bacterium RIFCSPLOWO2_12_FULL_64_10]|uniref:Uncharacterized protein n=1 Tax=Handelsmanbacteria sp. (strain RIFCSPLOWO2_12_FULL_64_10) TaxID=1817868 RepID=A0A1F6CL96_HANXR|nr:MAG: hypothetical protein A3F84_02295 [Candidatus Handelsmanbacteria bacterium RIFCSPLOWO2_12_FULL_64_10]